MCDWEQQQGAPLHAQGIPRPSHFTGKAPKWDLLQELKIEVLTADAGKHPNTWPLDLPAAEDRTDPQPHPMPGWPPVVSVTPDLPLDIPLSPRGQPKPPALSRCWVMPGAGSEEVKLPTPAGCSILGWALSILFWFGGIKALAAAKPLPKITQPPMVIIELWAPVASGDFPGGPGPGIAAATGLRDPRMPRGPWGPLQLCHPPRASPSLPFASSPRQERAAPVSPPAPQLILSAFNALCKAQVAAPWPHWAPGYRSEPLARGGCAHWPGRERPAHPGSAL